MIPSELRLAGRGCLLPSPLFSVAVGWCCQLLLVVVVRQFSAGRCFLVSAADKQSVAELVGWCCRPLVLPIVASCCELLLEGSSQVCCFLLSTAGEHLWVCRALKRDDHRVPGGGGKGKEEGRATVVRSVSLKLQQFFAFVRIWYSSRWSGEPVASRYHIDETYGGNQGYNNGERQSMNNMHQYNMKATALQY